MTEEEREKAKDLAISAIRKKHGKQALILSSDDFPEIDWISTTSLGLDRALGGGIPRGRIVELYGPESGGKTTLALHVVASCQKEGGLCAFIDAEHALDPEYATNLGVDINKLTISQPDNGEQALDIVDTLVRSQAYGLIVVDSVAALVPQAELEGDMGSSHMGLQARLMSQACRKLTAIVKTSNTAVIFINQIRMKIGIMFGNPETVSGGNALRFYTSQRIDIRRIGSVKEGDQIIANRTRAKVIKNKVAPPARQAEFNIVFGQGIDSETELIDMAVSAGIVKKSGAWFSYRETNIGQGKVKAATVLKNHPDLREAIEQKVREAL